MLKIFNCSDPLRQELKLHIHRFGRLNSFRFQVKITLIVHIVNLYNYFIELMEY